MSVTRGNTTAFNAALEGVVVQLDFLLKLEFEDTDTSPPTDATIRVWSGLGDITFSDEVYTGVGDLGQFENIKETSQLRSHTVAFTLSGVPSTTISDIFNFQYQGRPITLWMAITDTTISPGFLNNPIIAFKGSMENAEIHEGREFSVIKVNAINNLANLEKAINRRFTPFDHRERLAVGVRDQGFDKVTRLQEQEIPWGLPGPRPQT